jgi:hypothetical protein
MADGESPAAVDEADPFLPGASGEAHRVLKERRVTLFTWGAVQTPEKAKTCLGLMGTSIA